MTSDANISELQKSTMLTVNDVNDTWKSPILLFLSSIKVIAGTSNGKWHLGGCTGLQINVLTQAYM